MLINYVTLNFITMLCFLKFGGASVCTPKCNKYYFDPYKDEAVLSEGEAMCSLPMITLRTILRGLVAVLTQIFPECAQCDGSSCYHRDEKREEPIKIFRQIVSCPSVPVPYYTCCPPPNSQIPPPPTMPTFMHTQL